MKREYWIGVTVLAALSCSAEAPPRVSQSTHALGYPTATWNPADPSNFTPGNRSPKTIERVVVHTAQGTYLGTQSWFKNPSANVSAHYVVSQSGDVAQMVDDSDYGWHVFCDNEASIGIEHEGYLEEPSTWYTPAMYEASARLTAWAALTYRIPIDRDHIRGHDEYTQCTDHGDPGSGWDWDSYIAAVQSYAIRESAATFVAHDAPASMTSGKFEIVSFSFTNDGNYTWGEEETLLGTREASRLANDFWVSSTRGGGPNTDAAYAGETIVFEVPVQAPAVSEPTTITETFQLIDEDGDWFGPTVDVAIEVTPDPDAPGDPMDPMNPGDPENPDDGDEGGGCRVGAGGGLASMFAVLLAAAGFRRRRR